MARAKGCSPERYDVTSRRMNLNRRIGIERFATQR